MEFQFSAEVRTTLHIESSHTEKRAYKQHQILTWCKEQGLIENGETLSDDALKQYAEQMFRQELQNDINGGGDMMLGIEDGMNERLRYGYGNTKTEIESVDLKLVHKASPGQFAFA